MATPKAYLGDFTMAAFWAVVAGLGASLMAERGELFDYWRERKKKAA